MAKKKRMSDIMTISFSILAWYFGVLGWSLNCFRLTWFFRGEDPSRTRKGHGYMDIWIYSSKSFTIVRSCNSNIRWQQMITDDNKRQQMTTDDVRWHQMTSDDTRWHQIVLDIKFASSEFVQELLEYWDILRDIKRYRVILRDIERYWEILRDIDRYW